MDDDGYPDGEELKRIAEWPYTDIAGMLEFVAGIWWCPSFGWHIEELADKEGAINGR